MSLTNLSVLASLARGTSVAYLIQASLTQIRLWGDSGWLLPAGIGLGCLLAAFLLIWLKPEWFARAALWLPVNLFYRIRVHGRENIPATGPVLFVCNHVSWVDAALVFVSQRRSTRFLVWAPFTKVPGLRWLLRFARGIPIDGSAGPRAIVHALKSASETLRQGEAVCIFAEGGITRTGFLLPFHRGFEQILKHCPATVIPVCLDHVWGSIFSFKGGKFLRKWPQTLPYPVTIAFGKPMPATATALEVRQVIQKMSADCAIARAGERRTVHRQFAYLATKHPFWVCLVDPPNRKVYNYGQVLTGARLLARRLKPLLKDDKMVGVWMPPTPGGAFANLALALLGKVSVNLNYTTSLEILHSCVKQCNIRRIVTAKLFVHKVPLDAGPGVELIYLEDLGKTITNFQRALTYLSVVLCPAWIMERALGLLAQKPDDLATVIFSSGSTGDPKGIMLSHRNLSANTESMVQAIDPTKKDRLMGILPFFHSFGYTVTLWVPLQVGASLVFHPDPRQAKEIGDIIREHKVTIFLSTPTLLRFCLKRCGPDDFRSVRILMVGAEKMPPALADEFQKKLGILPMEGYGCTELSPAAIVNVPDVEDGGVRQVGNKLGTIGQPLPGIAARIVDPDTGKELPPGQPGMLLVYGGNVMMGYLNRPEATAAVVRDGWYETGDIARYDEDGFITITDRLSRFSKVGGEMVPHQKIEDELQDILGTAERTFVVTGVPDERKGERLIVFHTPVNGTTAQDFWRRLNDRGLPNLWVPGPKDFFEIPELPVLGTGKIDLKRIKNMALEKAR